MPKRQLGRKSVEKDVKALRPLIYQKLAPASAVDHGSLGGLSDDDHSQYVHISAARTISAQHSFSPSSAQAPFSLGVNAQGRLVTGLYADQLSKSINVSGLGLSGGGTFTEDRTITLTSSSNPGAAAAILASDANGGLFLDTDLLSVDAANDKVGIGDNSPYYLLDVDGIARATEYRIGTGDPATSYLGFTGSDLKLYSNSGIIETSPVLRMYYDATYSATLTLNSTGNLIVAPYADFVFDPGGNDILPSMAYDLNIGSLNRKYLTLHAAELWVETLVAQNTIATIGGRILVGPTTVLTEDLESTDLMESYNPGFETAGGGGTDVFASWIEYATGGEIAQSSTYYHGGSYGCSLRYVFGTPYVYSPDLTVTAGDKKQLIFWARGDGSVQGQYSVWDVTNENNIIAATNTGVTGTTWTRVAASFTIPAGCTQIRIYLLAPTALGYAYFDDVSVLPNEITVKHNQMASGDTVYMEADGKVEFMSIDSAASGAGPYTYTVTRNLDGTGANDWYAGDAVFNTGTTGDGFIDLYSISSVKGGTQYGPTIVGNVRNSATYNDWTEHWAIGNLNGLYGFGSNEFGIGLGKYSGANYITIDSTNGIRFLDTDDIVRAQLTGTSWTIGRTGYYKTVITDSAFTMYKNADDRTFIVNTNGVFMGDYTNTEANRSYVYIDTSGNMKFVRGTNTNIQLYATGSAAFGRVSSTHANAFWNESNDRLEFRGGTGGTVVQSYIDTDGSFVNGTGDVVINNSGVSIKASNIGGNIGKLTFPGTLSDIGYVEAYQGSAVNNYFLIEAKTHNSVVSDLLLEATGNIYFTSPGQIMDQGAYDGYALQCKSSDVAHGITTYAETDTYCGFKKSDAGLGGVRIDGFTEDKIAVQFLGGATTADTTHGTAGVAPVVVNSALKSSTTLTSVSSDGNLFVVRNASNTQFIVDAEGDVFINGTQTSYDDYDDLALIRGFEQSMTKRGEQIDRAFKSWMEARRDELVKIGIMQPEPGNYFYNVTRLQRLQNGALWQLHERLEKIEQALNLL